MFKSKKSQFIFEVFKYLLVGLFSMAILITGYITIKNMRDRECNAQTTSFELSMHELDKKLRFGQKELIEFESPCKINKIIFIDFKKNIDLTIFNQYPLIKDAINTKSSNNVFLIRGGKVIRSFSAGNIDIKNPHYLCLEPLFEKTSIYLEGMGGSAEITVPEDQIQCSLT